MNIPLRIIDFPESLFKTEVGDMWRTPANDHENRECWFIHLPNGVYWYTTADETGKDGWNGWTVTGEPPNITVTPSINAEGHWHGFITNGELVGV